MLFHRLDGYLFLNRHFEKASQLTDYLAALTVDGVLEHGVKEGQTKRVSKSVKEEWSNELLASCLLMQGVTKSLLADVPSDQGKPVLYADQKRLRLQALDIFKKTVELT